MVTDTQQSYTIRFPNNVPNLAIGEAAGMNYRSFDVIDVTDEPQVPVPRLLETPSLPLKPAVVLRQDTQQNSLEIDHPVPFTVGVNAGDSIWYEDEFIVSSPGDFFIPSTAFSYELDTSGVIEPLGSLVPTTLIWNTRFGWLRIAGYVKLLKLAAQMFTPRIQFSCGPLSQKSKFLGIRRCQLRVIKASSYKMGLSSNALPWHELVLPSFSNALPWHEDEDGYELV